MRAVHVCAYHEPQLCLPQHVSETHVGKNSDLNTATPQFQLSIVFSTNDCFQITQFYNRHVYD